MSLSPGGGGPLVCRMQGIVPPHRFRVLCAEVCEPTLVAMQRGLCPGLSGPQGTQV